MDNEWDHDGCLICLAADSSGKAPILRASPCRSLWIFDNHPVFCDPLLSTHELDLGYTQHRCSYHQKYRSTTLGSSVSPKSTMSLRQKGMPEPENRPAVELWDKILLGKKDVGDQVVPRIPRLGPIETQESRLLQRPAELCHIILRKVLTPTRRQQSRHKMAVIFTCKQLLVEGLLMALELNTIKRERPPMSFPFRVVW